ncbi:MAG: uroporphyrinogen decarboxylase [Planctomycetota bacterium]
MSPAKPLLAALACQPGVPTPVWLMRQAGRTLPEYRALKKRHGFLELATTPELAAQVTLQPVERFGFDAAILFADILTPLLPLDFGIQFRPGPVLERPVRGPQDLGRVHPPPAGSLDHVAETLRMVQAALPPATALLGFAGAPFTLAAYLLDGGGTREHAGLRAALYGDPSFLAGFLDRLAALTISYLELQIEAGAEAVQLFDTWAGLLPEPVYRRTALPAARKVLQTVGTRVPAIYFVKDGAHLTAPMGEAGASCLSLDWRAPLDTARKLLGPGVAVQGNLDPGALLGTADAVRKAAREILARNAGAPGHIFNLGHGILPQTPLENISVLLEEVREHEPAVR